MIPMECVFNSLLLTMVSGFFLNYEPGDGMNTLIKNSLFFCAAASGLRGSEASEDNMTWCQIDMRYGSFQ